MLYSPRGEDKPWGSVTPGESPASDLPGPEELGSQPLGSPLRRGQRGEGFGRGEWASGSLLQKGQGWTSKAGEIPSTESVWRPTSTEGS